jgi:predicted N-acetyltransferase YhbS
MISIRLMRQSDVQNAERVFRLAFGTRFGLADPLKFRGDGELIGGRIAATRDAALVAEQDGAIIGGAIGMDWGSVFIIGPVFVDPAHAGRGIARMMMARMLELIDARQKTLAALFTFPESAMHLRLYERFGFVPQLLTPVMAKAVPAAVPAGGALFSELTPIERAAAVAECRALTDAIFPGLDLTGEIGAMASTPGDVVLLDRSGAGGFAICHIGAGSEASSGNAFVKFGAVRPNAPDDFVRLLDGCDALAAKAGATRISAGVNVGRAEAYRLMQSHGYRTGLVGVAMLRPGGIGYNRPDAFVIDDWR